MKRFKSALLMISILLIAIGCSKLTPEELITSAKQNVEQGNLQTATIELKNAISQNNKLGEARVLLGRIYLRQSQYEAAEKELLRAADMGATYADIYPYLIKVYYYQEDFEGVISLADRIMSVLKDDVKPSLALYQFLAQLRLPGQDVNQVDIPDTLVGDRRKLAEAYTAFLDKDYEGAKAIADEFNDQSPDKVEQFFLSGLISNQLGDLERAATYFTAVLDEYINYHLVRFLLIDVLLRNELLDQADKQVDKILAINKNQPQANYYKGAIAFQRKDFENAFFYSGRAREGKTQGLRNYIVHGMSGYKLGKYETAYSSLLKAASQLPRSHSVHRLIAQLQIELGHGKEAADTLASMDNITDIDALLFQQSASLFATDGDYEMATKQFKTMNKLIDEDAYSELMEGVSKIAARDMSGIKNIQKSLEMDPSNDQAWLFLAELYMDDGRQEDALKLAKEWQKINKANGLVLEGQIYIMLEQYDNAVQALEAALKIEEFNIAALSNMVKVLLKQGKSVEALDIAFKILNRDPRNKYISKYVIIAANKTEDYITVKAFFEELVKNHPDLEEPLWMLSSLLRTNGENAAAIQILEENRSLLSIYGLASLGDAYYNTKQYDKAEAVYLEWRDKAAPTSAIPWIRLVGLYAIDNKSDKSYSTVTEAVAKFPRSEPLRLAKLRFHMHAKEYSAARQELKFLKDSQSKNIILNKMEGLIAMIDGEYERAVPLLLSFYKASQSIDDAINLSMAYIGAGQKDQAKALFENLIKAEPDSLPVKVQAAEFMSTNGYTQEAITLYKEIASDLPTNPLGYNNLSTAYLRLGQNDLAVAAAEKAIEIAPDLPQVMDTYGWALYKKGDIREAKSILAVAHGKLSSDINIALNYAEVLVNLGEITEASRVLRPLRAVTGEQEIRLKALKRAIAK